MSEETKPTATGTPPAAGTAESKTPPAPPTEPTKETKPAGDVSVPEKYEYKKPEGWMIADGSLGKIEAFAKAQGFSNEEAQALINHQHELVTEFVKSEREKHVASLEKTKSEWITELQSDKEFGGEKLKETSELVRRLLEKHGGEKLVKTLDETGFGNYPPLFRLMAKVARSMKDDGFVFAGAAPADKKPMADILYPSTAPKT